MGRAKPPPIVSALDGGRLFHKIPPIPTAKYHDNPSEETAETGPEEKYSPNDHQPRSSQDPTTIEWFLQNSSGKIKRILKQATQENLADKLTDMITQYAADQGHQGACLKMLVCKSSPFIWGMQKSVKKYMDPKDKVLGDTKLNAEITEEDDSENRLFNVNNFFTHLPSIEEYREYGEKCEKLYAINCNTTDLYRK